jgi:TolB-like protein
MHTYKRLPVTFERGEGCWLWDKEGKRYLDALAGIAVVGIGHSHPRFVQTLPRKGYSFIAPVHTNGNAVEPPAPPQDASSAGRRSRTWIPVAAVVALLLAVGAWMTVRRAGGDSRTVIAVSIFDNETGLAQYDRLVAGLSDLVVARLTELAPARIGVVGNAQVLRQPRNIRNLQAVAAGVRADYVILGQLQQAETGLRFITHFIRLSDGTHLRANRIPLPDGNVAGLEGAVVAEFERAVHEHVLGN